jgi:tetratricopeptide (TPR) repeat protein
VKGEFERALLLFEQNRFQQAAQILGDLLAEDALNSQGQALLALSLVRLKQYAKATELAQQAIHHSPDHPFVHYALADVLYLCDRLKAAETALEEALRLNPVNENFYSLRAGILMAQQNWSGALDAAEAGLELNGEHSGCQHLRSLCLKQLNRLPEAAEAIEQALKQHPDDALSHANQGWLWLEQGYPDLAQRAFREALRLQPDLDWARRGMLQALKAANLIYGLFLRYALWMAKLSEGKRWLVVAMVVVGLRLLRLLAASGSAGVLIVTPLIFLYVSFVLFSWIADPLFNVVLRFNAYGRLLLSREEVTASNWIGGLLMGGMSCGLIAIGVQRWEPAVGTALTLGLVIPIAAIFQCDRGWPRRTMTIYGGLLAIVGGLGWGLVWQAPTRSIGIALLILFGLGVTASSFLANLLINRTVPK